MIDFDEKFITLKKYSNYLKVFQNAKKYYGDDVLINISSRKDKKYQIYNPIKNKWIHFGQMGYEDFTYHNDNSRRENYLKRAMNIRGDWRNDPYSPNNLSIALLWS
jgi:hypothetical protein